MKEFISNLGPLGFLLGTWEGEKGDDTAPSDDRGVERNPFRETMLFEALTPVVNHEQTLYGLRYSTKAFRLIDGVAFHEELGYWLWDPKENQVLRCFMIPRGVTIIAGGTVEVGANEFRLSAKQGSSTYGICSNRFLDEEFKTIRYDLTVRRLDERTFYYEEDTQIIMKGCTDVFHHVDKNTMTKQ